VRLARNGPPRIILVHDVPEFAGPTALALRTAGYDVSSFSDTMAALDEFDAEAGIDVLVTRVYFPPGQPHGVSLAQMALMKRPSIKVLFVGVPERREHTEGVGELLTAPVTAADVVETVGEMLVGSVSGARCPLPIRPPTGEAMRRVRQPFQRARRRL
jgi:hypothetical protein